MSTWEIAPNIFAVHIDPTVVPVALQHSELTEVITYFQVLSEIQSTQPALHHSAPDRGMLGDNLDQPNRC